MVLLALAGALMAQRGVEPAVAPKPEPALVGVVGASVSAGFSDPAPRPDGERNRTVPLRQVLAPLWADGVVTIRDRSDLATFLQPVKRQTPQIERLVKDEPSLVVGLDFMFWFGYGYVGQGEQEEKRLALQDHGLELLGRLSCPIVVGDYPDMHGADERMLSPFQIPSTETLDALNAKLKAWVAEHPNVHLFPLAEWVARVKRDGIDVQFDKQTVHLTPERLLQGDRLHATRLGMAVLGEHLARFLREVLAEDDPLRPRAVTLEQLVTAADATFDMQEAIAAGKAEAEPGESENGTDHASEKPSGTKGR